MTDSPWTSDDPQPGDFDADLDLLDPGMLHRLAPNPDAKATLLVAIDSEDAARLERISAARGEDARQVISELLRDADRSAA